MSEWKSIESAPRNGTRIWAWFPYKNGGAYAVSWRHNVYDKLGPNWTLDDGESAMLAYDDPTH